MPWGAAGGRWLTPTSLRTSQVALGQKATFKPQQKAGARAPVARAVSCSAQQDAGKALAAAALAVAISFTGVEAAKADVAGLTPCSESKAFAKREKNEVKALAKRLKQVWRRMRWDWRWRPAAASLQQPAGEYAAAIQRSLLLM